MYGELEVLDTQPDLTDDTVINGGTWSEMRTNEIIINDVWSPNVFRTSLQYLNIMSDEERHLVDALIEAQENNNPGLSSPLHPPVHFFTMYADYTEIDLYVYYNCFHVNQDNGSQILTYHQPNPDLSSANFIVRVGDPAQGSLDLAGIELQENGETSNCPITGYTLEQKNWLINGDVPGTMNNSLPRYNSNMMQFDEDEVMVDFSVQSDASVIVVSDVDEDLVPGEYDCQIFLVEGTCDSNNSEFPDLLKEVYCMSCGGGYIPCQLAGPNTDYCVEEINIYASSVNGTLPVPVYTKYIIYETQCLLAFAAEADWTWQTPTCEDTDTTNVIGNGCSVYDNNPQHCIDFWDDDDFIATEMCCYCIGEQIPPNFADHKYRMGEGPYDYQMPIVLPQLPSGGDISECGNLIYSADVEDVAMFSFIDCEISGVQRKCIEADATNHAISEFRTTYQLHVSAYFDLYPSVVFTYPTDAHLQVEVFDCEQDLVLLNYEDDRDDIIFPFDRPPNESHWKIVLNDTDNVFYAIADSHNRYKIQLTNVGHQNDADASCGAITYTLEQNDAWVNSLFIYNYDEDNGSSSSGIDCTEIDGEDSSCYVQVKTNNRDPNTFSFNIKVSNAFMTSQVQMTGDITVIFLPCDYYPIEVFDYTYEDFYMNDADQQQALITWEDFTQTHPACVMNHYKSTCFTPNGLERQHSTDGTASGEGIQCDMFDYSFLQAGSVGPFTTEQRQIVLTRSAATLNPLYEGTYTFKIEGWNNEDSTGIGEINISFTLFADCSTATVTQEESTIFSGETVLIQQVLEPINDWLRPYASLYPHTCQIQYSLYESGTGATFSYTGIDHIKEVSEETVINGETWSDLKGRVDIDLYQRELEYLELPEYERLQVDTLIAAQNAQGDMLELPLTPHNFPTNHVNYLQNSPGTIRIWANVISNLDAYAAVLPRTIVLELKGELILAPSVFLKTTFDLQIDQKCNFNSVYLEGTADDNNEWTIQVGQQDAAGAYLFEDFVFPPRKVIQDINGIPTDVSITCSQADSDYTMMMINPDKYPYDPSILEFDPSLLLFRLNTVSDTPVQILSNGQLDCNLSTPNVDRCEIRIEIYTRLSNDYLNWETGLFQPARLIGAADLTILSECFTMSEIPIVWTWSQADKDAFRDGYQLRGQKKSLNLPSANVTLRSGLDVIETCGPMSYSISHTDNCVLTCAYAVERCKEMCPCSAEDLAVCDLNITPEAVATCQSLCPPTCSTNEDESCDAYESTCQNEQCEETDSQMLNDMTVVGDSTWAVLKSSEIDPNEYIPAEIHLIEALTAAQSALGDGVTLEDTLFRTPFSYPLISEESQPQIEVQTYNTNYVKSTNPYLRIYQFNIQMEFVEYKGGSYYWQEGDPEQVEMQYTIYDGCTDAMWNTPRIKFGPANEVDSQDQSDDLSATVYVLDDQKKLLFFQSGYTNTLTNSMTDCGDIQYFVQHIPGITSEPNIGFNTGNTELNGFSFYLEVLENSLIGAHTFSISASFTVITENAAYFGQLANVGADFNVEITVLPCYLKEFTTGPQIEDFTINFNGLPRALSIFQAFNQVPPCGHDITYTITVLERSNNNIFVDFKDEFESTQPDPPLVTFYKSNRYSVWKCTGVNQVQRTYDVFINGKIQLTQQLVNSMVENGLVGLFSEDGVDNAYTFSDIIHADGQSDQHYSLLEVQIPTFHVSIGEPLYLINNSPPQLVAGQSVLLSPGDIYKHYVAAMDFEENSIYIDSWSADVTPDWMKFTNATSIDECNFEFFPPENTPDTDITLRLVLGDNHERTPMLSQPQLIAVSVVSQDIGTFDITLLINEDRDEFDMNLPAPMMSYESVEELVLSIKFSDLVLYPDNIREYSGKNEGAEIFELKYYPSEATKSYLYENDIWQSFDWFIEDLDPENIKIKLRFGDYRAVSTDSMDQDMITFKVLKTDIFVGARNRKPIEITRVNERKLQQVGSDPILPPNVVDVVVDFKLYIKPKPMMDAGTEATLNEVKDAFEDAIKSVIGANVVLGLFIAGALQYMWGMIHSLQMIVLTALFNIYSPTNANIILVSILQLTAYDFYQTEELYGEVFGLEQGRPFNPIFEHCGFDSSNFIIGIGPLFMYYIIFPAYMILHMITRYVLKDQFVHTWINKFSEKDQYGQKMMRFLLESCLEVGLTSLISLKIRSVDENFGTFWNTISWFLAGSSLVGLIISPFYVFYASYKYHKFYDTDADIRELYHPMFDNYYRRSLYAVTYQTLFFLRRYVMVFVLIFFNTSELLQINLISLSCLVILVYVALHKPFKEQPRNLQETFNEINVLLASYPLFYYTTFSPSEILKYKMGWVSITCIVCNMVLNIGFIIYINGGKSCRKFKLYMLKRQHTKAMKERAQRQAQAIIDERIQQSEYKNRLMKLFPVIKESTVSAYNADKSVLRRISESDAEESQPNVVQERDQSVSKLSLNQINKSEDCGFLGEIKKYENYEQCDKVRAQDLLINAKPRKFNGNGQRIGRKVQILGRDLHRGEDLADKYIRDIAEGRSPYMNEQEESKNLSVRSDSSQRYKEAQLELLNMSSKFSVNNISLVDYDEPVQAKVKPNGKKSRKAAVVQQFDPQSASPNMERRNQIPYSQVNKLDSDTKVYEAVGWENERLVIHNPDSNIPTPSQFLKLQQNSRSNSLNKAPDTERMGAYCDKEVSKFDPQKAKRHKRIQSTSSQNGLLENQETIQDDEEADRIKAFQAHLKKNAAVIEGYSPTKRLRDTKNYVRPSHLAQRDQDQVTQMKKERLNNDFHM